MRRRDITMVRYVFNVKQVERSRILASPSPLVALLDRLVDRPDALYIATFGAQ